MNLDIRVQGHLDPAVVQSLLDMVDGDVAFVDDLVDTYLEDAQLQLASMRATVDAGDADALARPAHTLKGSSLNLGATRLAGICGQLESAARRAALGGAAELVEAAEAEYALVVEALASARRRGWDIRADA